MQSQTHKQSLFVDFLNLFSGNAFQMVCAVALGVATARIWGADGRGLIAVIMIWPTLVCRLTYLGNMRSLPYLIGRKVLPMEEAGRVITTLWVLFSALCLGISLIGLLTMYDEQVTWPWVVGIAVWVSLEQFSSLGSGFALAMQRSGFLRNSLIIRSPIALAFILITGWAMGYNAISDTWLYIAGLSAGFLAIAILFVKLILSYTSVGLTADLRKLYEAANSIIRFGLSGIMMHLNYFADVFILSLPVFMVPKEDIGNYSVGVAAASILWQIPKALGQVMLSKGAASEDPAGFDRQVAAVARVSIILAIPIMLVVFVLSPYLFPLVYGADFDKTATIVQILCPSILAFFAARIYESGFNAKGMNTPLFTIMGAVAVVNILLNIWWIPIWGIYGAAWASALTYPLGTILLGMSYVKHSQLTFKELVAPRADDMKPLFRRIKRMLKLA